ncbi:VOC family protein [Acrocarpospora sp. B8E8]|uniref:VOC family protein n=1 Tax=Acrocarpospora sp. B8E8 TaxID=3153572 RepID=UPI00325EAE52
MSEIGFGLVLDAADPEALAPFWAAALRYTVVGGVGAYVLLVPEGRSGPKLLLQKVPEGKSGKNRMHLDIEVLDIQAEADRLEALGARRLRPGAVGEHGHRWILMVDPEGNEFCVCDAGTAQ